MEDSDSDSDSDVEFTNNKTYTTSCGDVREYTYKYKRTPKACKCKICREFIIDILDDNQELFNDLSRREIAEAIQDEFIKENIKDVKLSYIIQVIRRYQININKKFNIPTKYE